MKLGEPSHPEPQSQPRCVFNAIIGADTEAPRLRGKYVELVKHVRQGQAESDHNPTGGGFQSCVRIIGGNPSPTLSKMSTGTGRATLIHPTEDRPISIGEAKRLASFPDSFRMQGTFIQRWARIGNSVPPLFMRAIAGHIRREILHR